MYKNSGVFRRRTKKMKRNIKKKHWSAPCAKHYVGHACAPNTEVKVIWKAAIAFFFC